MKILKGLLYAAIGIGALLLFGRFFISQMESGGSGRSDQPAGVLLSPPPGYSVIERSELSLTAAASELEAQALGAGTGKVGIHFRREGSEVYWLADLPAETLEERSAGASGTRLQTVWREGCRERLAWAKTHGTFDVPGLTPGERVNLYH